MHYSSKLLTVAGFLAFFAFGFIDNLKGPVLPEMVRDGQFNYAQAGTIVMAGYIGFIISTLTTGILADWLSSRTVLWLAGLFLGLGTLGMGLGHTYWVFVLCMGVTGLGLGAIELGANALMVQLHSARRGRYLNLLSVFHGCGSLTVPLLAAWLIGLHWDWQTIYGACILFAAPLLILFVPVKGPRASPSTVDPVHTQPQVRTDAPATPQDSAHASAHTPSETISPLELWRVGFTPTMLAYYLLIAAYVAVELSTATWMMEYLQQDHKMSVEVSSRFLSAFFVLLMLGRLLGAMIV
ncbi:MAG: MFS transporter, partial [Pirellulaceae bacterium]|nr:MFS transporter [Pirellulaceae bacterium]